MVTIEDISVTTAVSDSEQALTIRADVDDGPTENLHYLRPLGTNTYGSRSSVPDELTDR